MRSYSLFEEQADGRRYVLERIVLDTGKEHQFIYLAEPSTDYEAHLAQTEARLLETLAEAEVEQLLTGSE